MLLLSSLLPPAAPLRAFSGGADGFWLDATPVSNFEKPVGTPLATYGSGYYGNTYVLWQDSSPNNRDAVPGGAVTDGYTSNLTAPDSWRFFSFTDTSTHLTVANAGGSTTGFYFAAALQLGQYYGTLFSDQTSSSATNGFRIYHNADGRDTGTPSAVPVIGFYANGAGNTGAIGDPDTGNANQAVVACPGTLFANASGDDLFVLECWWEGTGTPLRARIDGGAIASSTNNIASVTAGSSTVVLNAVDTSGTDRGETGWYEAVYTKNYVPATADRDAIRAYLTDRIRSGGARGLVGQSATTARGDASPPPPGIDVALTGQSMTSARGTMGTAEAIALTGQAVTAARGTLVYGESVPLTGQAVTAKKGFTSHLGFDAVAAIKALRINSGAYTGGYLIAPAGRLQWYFTNLALRDIVPYLSAAELDTYIRVYLDLYLAKTDPATKAINDVNDPTGTPVEVGPDSHDAYAGTLLHLAVLYVRASGNSAWWTTNLTALKDIAFANMAAQQKPSGLFKVYQGGSPSAVGYLMDACECFGGLRRFADELAARGDSDASYYDAVAGGAANGVNSLWDATNNAYKASDAETTATTVFYAGAVCQVFPRIFNIPTESESRFDFATAWLNAAAPGWFNGTYDTFPWLALAYGAKLNGDTADALNHRLYAEHLMQANRAAMTINELGWLVAAVPDVSVGLTGQSLTSARGTLGTDLSAFAALTGHTLAVSRGNAAPDSDTQASLTGQGATSARGALVPNTSVALSGLAATTARGTVTPLIAITAALTGQGVTSAPGTLGVTHDNALTGQAATSARGTMVFSETYPLTGQGVATAQGTVTPALTTVVALTGLSMTAARDSMTPGTFIAVALTGRSVTASRGTPTAAYSTAGSAFREGAQGVWLDASPIGNFIDTATGSSALTAYSTRATYGANGYFGKWLDLSGNTNHALQTDNAARGAPLSEAAWMRVANIYDDLTVANAGGSTTSFYFAAAVAVGSYYCTIFSDRTTAGSNNGLRIYYNADGDGTNGVIGFVAGTAADHATEQNADPALNPNSQVLLTTANPAFTNASLSNAFVIECWYDGTRLYGRINGGPVIQSVSTVTVSAGSSTAYLNSNVGEDYGSGGTDLYAVVQTKNYVPNQVTRDGIRAYLMNKVLSGGARGLFGHTLAVHRAAIAGALPTTTVALTGLAATAARGTAGVTHTNPLAGRAVAMGFSIPETTHSRVLTGQSATVTQGIPSDKPPINVALTGQSMTTARGTAGVTRSSSLAGQEVAIARGVHATGRSNSVSGQALATTLGTVIPQINSPDVEVPIDGVVLAVTTSPVGTPTVWVLGNSGQVTGWAPVGTTQTPGWSTTSDTSVPGWTTPSS